MWGFIDSCMLCCLGWGGIDNTGFIGYTAKSTAVGGTCQSCGNNNTTSGRPGRIGLKSTQIEFYSSGSSTTNGEGADSPEEDETSCELDGIFEEDQIIGEMEDGKTYNAVPSKTNYIFRRFWFRQRGRQSKQRQYGK